MHFLMVILCSIRKPFLGKRYSVRRHPGSLIAVSVFSLLFAFSTPSSGHKDMGSYQLPAPLNLSALTILTATEDTILYDNNTAAFLDTTSNAWTGVRFTPLDHFEFQAIYFAILNQYNNTADGCSLYVVADDGAGEPNWPSGILDSFWVPPPLPDMIWIQVDLSLPISFSAYEDFHVIYGPAPGGPYPGTGWWNLLDSDGTSTERSLVSHDNRATWLTIAHADAFIRAGGEYVEELLCGDCTDDGSVDAGDVVYLITYLFRDGPSPEPLCVGDVNCNGVVDAGDVVYLIGYLFREGPLPCSECCSGSL